MPSSQKLRATLDVLLTPLSHETVDLWRDEVCRALRRWVDSDAAMFRVSDGSPTRMDPLDAMVPIRDLYRAGGFRADDPWAAFRVRRGHALLGTFEDLLGARWEERSRFARELMQPARVFDYVGIQVGTPGGEFVTLATMNLGRPRGGDYLTEARQRLNAILPALKVGVAAWHAARPTLADIGGMVDEVPTAALLLDAGGRPVHANSALSRLVAADPEDDRLKNEIERLGQRVAGTADGSVVELHGNSGEHRIRTRGGSYAARVVHARDFVRGDVGSGLVVTLERIAEGGGGRADD